MSPDPSQSAKIVETSTGRIRGRRHPSGGWEYLGIPYGQDTGGKNRFQPARPAGAWAGIRDAFTYGPDCPQGGWCEHPDYAVPLPDVPAASEDCLKLNIWTPDENEGGKRPVMVWLHGGGFSVGTASQTISNGGNLAAFGDAVIVSLNHRLNVFGFLFRDDAPNLGLTDIVLALEWLRDNVAAFGGDPGNVTLFGMSGGGRKICCLMAMPAAQGLFHRAIVQSGPHPRCISRDQASEFSVGFLKHLDLPPGNIDRLQTIPAKDLHDLAMAYCDTKRDPAVARWMMSPAVDGKILPADPWGGSAPTPSRNIPLLIGANKGEAALHLARHADAGRLSQKALEEQCTAVLGPRGATVLAAHAKVRPQATPWELLVGIASEDRRLMSADIAVQKARQNAAPAYLYSFAYETDFGLYGAAHGIEVPYIFRTLEHSPMTGSRKTRHAVCDSISQAWLRFARDGFPQMPGVAIWPPYDETCRAMMVIDTIPQIENDPQRLERKAFGTTKKCMPWETESFAVILALPAHVTKGENHLDL